MNSVKQGRRHRGGRGGHDPLPTFLRNKKKKGKQKKKKSFKVETNKNLSAR